MRCLVLAVMTIVTAAGCESKPAGPAALVELGAATGLAPVRAAFNAHKGEARFLTLLSPT